MKLEQLIGNSWYWKTSQQSLILPYNLFEQCNAIRLGFLKDLNCLRKTKKHSLAGSQACLVCVVVCSTIGWFRPYEHWIWTDMDFVDIPRESQPCLPQATQKPIHHSGRQSTTSQPPMTIPCSLALRTGLEGPWKQPSTIFLDLCRDSTIPRSSVTNRNSITHEYCRFEMLGRVEGVVYSRIDQAYCSDHSSGVTTVCNPWELKLAPLLKKHIFWFHD